MYTIKLVSAQHNRAEWNRLVGLIYMLSVFEPNGSFRSLFHNAYHDYCNDVWRFKSPPKFDLAVAYNDKGAMVGYALYYRTRKHVEWFVLPAWRNKGVGSALVKGLKPWCGNSILTGYSGFGDYQHFYEKNYILNLDEFASPPLDQVVKYGGHFEARAALIKAKKLRLAGARAKDHRWTTSTKNVA